MSLLQIRPEHMRAFEVVSEDQLVSDIVRVLRKEHSSITDRIYDDYLGSMVRAGLARARRRGLTLDTALTAFVVLMFEVAPNFDEHPAIEEALRPSSCTPDQRFFELRHSVPDRTWDEAAERYRAEAWRFHE